MELMTAFDSAIVAQMLEKDAFIQSEFGISAGLFPLTWQWDHATKDGSAATARHKMTMASAVLIREGSALKMLLPG